MLNFLPLLFFTYISLACERDYFREQKKILIHFYDYLFCSSRLYATRWCRLYRKSCHSLGMGKTKVWRRSSKCASRSTGEDKNSFLKLAIVTICLEHGFILSLPPLLTPVFHKFIVVMQERIVLWVSTGEKNIRMESQTLQDY